MLAVKICRALGLGLPDLEKLPPVPEGLLTTAPRIISDQIRPTRSDLAPRPELTADIVDATSRAGSNSRHMVAAVAGMGDVGKTLLARSVAVEHQDDYHAMWWIDAERRDATLGNMPADIAALGAELLVDIKAEAPTNIEQCAPRTLRLIENAGFSNPVKYGLSDCNPVSTLVTSAEPLPQLAASPTTAGITSNSGWQARLLFRRRNGLTSADRSKVANGG